MLSGGKDELTAGWLEGGTDGMKDGLREEGSYSVKESTIICCQ